MDGKAATAGRTPVDLRPHGLRRWLPVIGWLKAYPHHGLRHDLEAGVFGAFVAVPDAIGFAVLAGLDPAAGLFAVIYAGVFFTIFTSSRHVAAGPTPTLSAIVALGIGAPVVSGPQAMHLAGALALMVGGMLLLASLTRVGALTRVISVPVMTGYLFGAALTVATFELGVVLGHEVTHPRFRQAALELFENFDELRWRPALFGIGVAVGYVGLRAIRRELAPVGTLVLATLTVAVFHLQRWGIDVVGRIPKNGLHLAQPIPTWAEAQTLFPAALAIFALVFLDSAQLARSFAQKYGYAIRPNQELLALGVANAATAAGGGFPIAGSSIDTRVAESLEARTPLSGLIVVLVALVVLWVGPNAPNMPKDALGVLVIGGIAGTVPWGAPRRIWRYDRAEFVLGVIAFLGVLGLGLVAGLLVAVAASIVRLMWLTSHPHTAQLGTQPEQPDTFVDLRRWPNARPLPGVLVYRVDAAMIFVNAEHVAQELLALVADKQQPTRTVVLDLRAVNFVDYSAYQMLERLGRDLSGRGIRLVGANAKSALRERLRMFGGRGGTLPEEFGEGDVRSAIRRGSTEHVRG